MVTEPAVSVELSKSIEEGNNIDDDDLVKLYKMLTPYQGKLSSVRIFFFLFLTVI